MGNPKIEKWVAEELCSVASAETQST